MGQSETNLHIFIDHRSRIRCDVRGLQGSSLAPSVTQRSQVTATRTNATIRRQHECPEAGEEWRVSSEDKAHRNQLLLCEGPTGPRRDGTKYIPSEDQLADPFTKALPGPRLAALRDHMGVIATSDD